MTTALGVGKSDVSMTSIIDIYRTATELIKQHGADAPIHAARWADELLDAGDVELDALGCP